MNDVGYITLFKVGVKRVTTSLLARQAAWGGVDLPPHLLNMLGINLPFIPNIPLSPQKILTCSFSCTFEKTQCELGFSLNYFLFIEYF